MKRSEWLVKLEQEMSRLGIERVREAVADYEEHFAIAMDAGKSEEEICEKLGDPVTVAKAHQVDRMVTSALPAGKAAGPMDMQGILRATLRVLILTPLNFFLLIGPFIVIASLLFTGWILAVVFGLLSLGATVLALISVPFLVIEFWSAGSMLFGSLAFVGFTVLGIMTLWVLTRVLLTWFVSYLQWNVNFVLEK